MKKHLVVGALTLSGIVLSACAADRVRKATKTKPKASANAVWETNLAKAKARAKREGKHVLVDFTGSKWCGSCIALKREVFDRPEFKKYAAENLVLVKVDLPMRRDGSPNVRLAESFGVRELPTVVILSPEGKEDGRTGYKPGGASSYVRHVERIVSR